MTLFLVHRGKKFLWAIRIIPECFQHGLKMYGWSLAENIRSVKIRCRFISLFRKQSFFHKYDFSAVVDILVRSIQRSPICGGLDLNRILFHRKKNNCEAADESIEVPKIYKYYGGGPSLVFSSVELQLYASADLQEKQYKFL